MEVDTSSVRGEVGSSKATKEQILFGDLHVHTTYSIDAFFSALPLNGGEGAHPLADARNTTPADPSAFAMASSPRAATTRRARGAATSRCIDAG